MSFNSTSISDAEVSLGTKIWKLSSGAQTFIVKLLNENNNWRTLAEVLTHPDHDEKPLFKAQDINVLESKRQAHRTPADVLIDHWSVLGVDQPSVKDLLKFLVQAGLLHTASSIERKLLFSEGSEKNTELLSEFSSSTFEVEHQRYEVVPSEISSIEEAMRNIDLGGITKYGYKELVRITQNFCDKEIKEGGCKLGEGTFGQVFRVSLFEKLLAVKRLKESVPTQFFTELKVLHKFKHENLLPLLGVSIDGIHCCLIYDYMENGSLYERLACKDGSLPIPCEIRMSIAYGSALGINHLHTFGEKPMVHRDIKSANILLDKNFVPKVGDFGLVRSGDSTSSSTMPVTEHVCGTNFYMALEAFMGDVSIKLDTFSFGVVLLELLTGLPPYDGSRDDRDLITFMENYEDIFDVIDSKIFWNKSSAIELYKIANHCLIKTKRKRPTISEVLEDLKNCCVTNTNENKN